MAFDYKKEYREFYLPPAQPGIVNVPRMQYLAVRGRGDPNAEGGAYQQAIGQLYAVAYTLKMGGKKGHAMDGYFDYVVPPLEGFWWQDGRTDVDYACKAAFRFIALIRLPEFVTAEDVAWAVQEAARKKKLDCTAVELLQYDEGLCVQCMHVGAYDDEPATVARMHAAAAQTGYVPDLSETRYHHEIYLSDARKVMPEKRKTVIRHPIRKA